MVEKIRDTYQKHTRNISSVSDISTTTAEPLKRDENAEIRVVLLTDSETERNVVFEAFSKSLNDGQSDLVGSSLNNHHWEQPHVECVGSDCRYCLRSGLPSLMSNSHDGFFRFTIQNVVFRLMLLSKDRQNYLKIISYDFICIGMQVTNVFGHLDENIWEFEWKRLERISKKAVSPLILIGYFRDILKLGHATNTTLEKTLHEARSIVEKAGKAHHVIPRFIDFVTGTSSQISEIFTDINKLYRHPGFVLQQCALFNNATHWTKILDNPNVCLIDLLYNDGDVSGDNCVMMAAKLRHKDLLSIAMRRQLGDDSESMSDLIHERNHCGQTLLSMVALQGPELEEQKLLILRKEIEIHCVSDITHEADQLKLQRCLRNQLKSSAEAAIILEQSRALQGIPKTVRELKAERGKVWSRLFFSSLLLSIVFNAIDTGSDVLIMIRYYGELMGDSPLPSNSSCGEEVEDSTLNCNVTAEEFISIQCLPTALSPESKFGYTLFFLLVPWPFFIYEFFTSRQYNQLVSQWKKIVFDISLCVSLHSLLLNYLKAIVHFFFFIFCVLLWPIAVLFIKYYNDGKYYLAKGAQRADREKKIETSEVLYSIAKVMEVSLESSFQPTIQLYIIFPVLVRTMTAPSFSLRIFTVCKTENLHFPMLKTDQTISIITSILSLAWCFTFYQATLKRGALDKDLAALFYRAVLFLSVLCQIIGRLFILVLFSYSFGPGNYFPVLIFLSAHILLMTILHFLFSDAKVYWDKGGFLNLSFFHYMIGNGLANIYIHNWIRMDPLLIPFAKPLQHVSTLVRQLVFDVVFVLENVILLLISLQSNIIELQENRVSFAVLLLGFTLFGLILKGLYYRYLHIWAWLILDFITEREDGHWKCLLFSNMYFCGELKERRLLLFCLPKPFFTCLMSLFGEKYFKTTETTCSNCSLILSFLFLPFAFLLGLFSLLLLFVLAIIFAPIFIFGFLPCILFIQIKNSYKNDNIIKIANSDSRLAGFSLSEPEVKLKDKTINDLSRNSLLGDAEGISMAAGDSTDV